MPSSTPDQPSHSTQPRLDPVPAAMGRLFVQRSSPVNLALMIGSVVLTIWTGFGADTGNLLPWLISLPGDAPQKLVEVRHGEVWRLFTPMFLHFSTAHIAFNLLNMLSLGAVIERRIGSVDYLGGTLVIALASNLTQYFVSGNPFFGGMSGVVYGLFGYVWLRSRVDRTFGLEIPKGMLLYALAWFLLCFTNFFGQLQIANWAHTGGLGLGCLWGTLDGWAAMRKVRAVGSLTL